MIALDFQARVSFFLLYDHRQDRDIVLLHQLQGLPVNPRAYGPLPQSLRIGHRED